MAIAGHSAAASLATAAVPVALVSGFLLWLSMHLWAQFRIKSLINHNKLVVVPAQALNNHAQTQSQSSTLLIRQVNSATTDAQGAGSSQPPKTENAATTTNNESVHYSLTFKTGSTEFEWTIGADSSAFQAAQALVNEMDKTKRSLEPKPHYEQIKACLFAKGGVLTRYRNKHTIAAFLGCTLGLAGVAPLLASTYPPLVIAFSLALGSLAMGLLLGFFATPLFEKNSKRPLSIFTSSSNKAEQGKQAHDSPTSRAKQN